MSDLTKAKRKLDRLYAEWKEANAALRDDRNIIAGEIYEQRKVIDALIDAQEKEEYAASFLDRWPA